MSRLPGCFQEGVEHGEEGHLEGESAPVHGGNTLPCGSIHGAHPHHVTQHAGLARGPREEKVVEHSGIEPLTSWVRSRRSPS